MIYGCSLALSDEQIAKQALVWAKANRTRLARDLFDKEKYLPEQNPVTVFMAGSPGAGKTETSKELVDVLESNGFQIARLDPDEIREIFPGYSGAKAHLFQLAVIRIVERAFDLAHKQSQSFILDGTLSSYAVAERNVAKSLEKGREVQILYVYQDPFQAWRFVRAREAVEGRRIALDVFVEQYFAARKTVNAIKQKFGKKVKVDVLMKNVDGSQKAYYAGVDVIDNFVPQKYDPEVLLQHLQKEKA